MLLVTKNALKLGTSVLLHLQHHRKGRRLEHVAQKLPDVDQCSEFKVLGLGGLGSLRGTLKWTHGCLKCHG